MHSEHKTTRATRRRREPERGALHQVLREHLATFLARTSEQHVSRDTISYAVSGHVLLRTSGHWLGVG